MNAAVSALRPAPANAATQPALTDALRATVGAKSAAALALLREAVAEFGAHGELAFANSFGAEDMVLTDLILSHALPITVFSLDTGRLPAETYTLIGEVERRYDTKLEIYFPDAGAVEQYVRGHGINAFYDSVELRKACCGVRKMEPLRRALAPDGDTAYRHDLEGDDDMAAHARSVLTETSLTLPVTDGRLRLGTWQGVYLVELRARPHRREVAALFQPG